MTKGFYIDTVVEEENIMGEKGKAHVAKLYTVHIFPPLFFKNLLPISVTVTKPVRIFKSKILIIQTQF